MKRSVVALVAALFLACGASRVPAALRGYDIVVEPKDSQSVELGRAMREYGYRVRQHVRGGSRPTAALIYFTYADPGQPPWLFVRLADTRTGAIVGSGAVPLDSVASSARARAQAAVSVLAP
jgi:hypothetical protein